MSMKPFFRNLAALTLSGLVLFSTVSFSVGMHFCGSQLVDLAFNEKAHGCGMEMGTASQDEMLAKAAWHCCEDVLMAVSGQEELQLPAMELPQTAPAAILPLTWNPDPNFLEIREETGPAPWYAPPPIIRDIPVLYQSFLI